MPGSQGLGCDDGDVAGFGTTGDGEQIVLRMHRHGKTLVAPSAILALIIAVASVVVIVLPSGVPHPGWVRLAVAATALVAAIVWFGVPVLNWRATTYELTTRRLRMREGIWTRSGRDFPLNRISDVSFSQGPIDRMFGCGRLIVESAGEHGQLILTEIPEVRRVQAMLFELVNDEATRAGWQDASGY